MRTILSTLALTVALGCVPAAAAAAAPAYVPAHAVAASVELPAQGTRYEIIIETTGLSDYELTRTEILVARRAQQRGLTVVDWHTGQGIIVETTSHALLADLLADPHVTGMRKVS